MDSIQVGTTGENVSFVCLGTIYFGNKTDPQTSRELLDQYYKAGGRFLDTANTYATCLDDVDEPTSEPFLIEWMADWRNRDELLLATKVGFEYGDVPQSFNPKVIEQAVEKSLNRHGANYVNLLYGHVDDRATPLAETIKAFDRLIESGEVRQLRVSSYYGWRLHAPTRLPRSTG